VTHPKVKLLPQSADYFLVFCPFRIRFGNFYQKADSLQKRKFGELSIGMKVFTIKDELLKSETRFHLTNALIGHLDNIRRLPKGGQIIVEGFVGRLIRRLRTFRTSDSVLGIPFPSKFPLSFLSGKLLCQFETTAAGKFFSQQGREQASLIYTIRS